MVVVVDGVSVVDVDVDVDVDVVVLGEEPTDVVVDKVDSVAGVVVEVASFVPVPVPVLDVEGAEAGAGVDDWPERSRDELSPSDAQAPMNSTPTIAHANRNAAPQRSAW